MTPSKCLSLLVLCLVLVVSGGPAVATEEMASSEDLARLASLQEQLEVRFSDQLWSRVDAAIHAGVGRSLAADITSLLAGQGRVGAQPAIARVPEVQPVARAGSLAGEEMAYDTTCTMVGQTLECVLRGLASR